MCGADLGERSFCAGHDLARRDTKVFEPEGDLAVDSAEHHLLFGILEDGRNRSGELGRPHDPGVPTLDRDPTFEAAAVKVRHQARQRAKQCRLARTRRAEDGHEFSRIDLDGHVSEGRRTRLRVRERHAGDAR